MIHEFDPYFNYRTTKYLAEEGFYKFHNWFDERAWYPLGRIIGGKYLYKSIILVIMNTKIFIYRNNLPWIDGHLSSSISCHELFAHFH